MSNDLNEGNICQVLFEQIPSDDNSDTSCDEYGNDEDYFLSNISNIQVVISKSWLDTKYEESEILNLDNNNILPSPLKKNLIFKEKINY